MSWVDDHILPFDEWYEENKYIFPDYLEESFSENLEYIHFLGVTYRQSMAAFIPTMQKLILEQYPVFATETRPKVLARINRIPEDTWWQFILKMYEVVQDQDVNLPLLNKYPELERWRNSYTGIKTPDTIDESKRDEYEWLTDEQWIEYRNSENKAMRQFFYWSENRQNEFEQLLKDTLKQYYPKSLDLGDDEQVLLAVHLDDEYDCYKTECEHIELFIDCGFDEDDIVLDYQEFNDKYSQLSREVKDRSSKLRDRRIAGEKI